MDQRLRVFKNRDFHRWAKDVGLRDNQLHEALAEIDKGLVEANLGANVYKKRIATGGKGKSGGFRTLICYKKDDKAFFVYGFGKGEKANISQKEKRALKMLSKELFSLTKAEISKAIKAGALTEIEPPKARITIQD